MTFITRTFREFGPNTVDVLATKPPTDESRELAEKIGRRMGELAYPGDMVRESIDYEAGKRAWPAEITNTLSRLAWDGLQRR